MCSCSIQWIENTTCNVAEKRQKAIAASAHHRSVVATRAGSVGQNRTYTFLHAPNSEELRLAIVEEIRLDWFHARQGIADVRLALSTDCECPCESYRQ